MKVAKARRSMTHAEVVIARQAVEEGRGLVVIVNKMDLLRGKQNLHDKVMEAVPEEIQMVIPQVCLCAVFLTTSKSLIRIHLTTIIPYMIYFAIVNNPLLIL